MPILKADQYPKGGFLKISNQFLRERELSWQAKGLLTFLLSYGKSYQHSFAGILKHSKDGECAIRNTLKELEIAGYLIRKMVNVPVNSPNLKGCRKKFEWIYTVLESPTESSTFFKSPSSGFPQVETPQVETPQVETPQVETPQVETPQVENRDAYNKEVLPYKEKPSTKKNKITGDGGGGNQDLPRARGNDGGDEIMLTPPPPPVFTEEEKKILAWADTQDYWGGLAERPYDARLALDNSKKNSLRDQYEKAKKTKDVSSVSSIKVKAQYNSPLEKSIAEKLIEECSYCDEEGYLQFQTTQGFTKMYRCKHDRANIEELLAKPDCLGCTTKKQPKTAQISTNDDEEVSIPMIASMALKKGIK